VAMSDVRRHTVLGRWHDHASTLISYTRYVSFHAYILKPLDLVPSRMPSSHGTSAVSHSAHRLSIDAHAWRVLPRPP